MQINYIKAPRIKGNAKDLVDHPIIIRVNDISETAAKDFSEKMADAHNTGQNVIPVVIDSFGGCVYALMSMMSDIENSQLPVATIVTGKAMSAGAILCCFGTAGIRFMDPNATMMIHEVSSWNGGSVSEQRVGLTELERINKLIFQKTAAVCGHKNRDYFLKLINKVQHNDHFFDAFEAKRHKMIDHLGMPELQIVLNMSIELVFNPPELVEID